MSFSAGSIISTLGLDVSPFAQGMLQANSIASIFPGIVTSFLANPLLGIVDLASQVAGSLVNMFESATGNADKLNDQAAAIGVNVEQLSALGLVAGQAGASTDTVADAFKFLGKNVSEALSGDKTANAGFAKLGIDAATLKANANDLPALLLKISDGMKNMSGGDRTASAMALLGRSGTELIPTLQQGSAAIQEQMDQFRAYGATVTGESASSADAWGDAIGEIGIAWEGLKNDFATPVRDALMPMLEDLVGWIRSHAAELRSIIQGIATVVTTAARVITAVLSPIVSLLSGLISGISSLLGTNVASSVSTISNSGGGSTFSSSTPAAANGGGAGVTIQNVNLPATNFSDGADQIAMKIAPVIKQANVEGFRRLDSAAAAAAARGAL